MPSGYNVSANSVTTCPFALNVARAFASLPGDGSHETGLRNLTRLARWVVSHVDARRIGAQPRC